MKVLNVINKLGYGGAERLLFNFVTHAREERPEVELEVCTLFHPGVLGEKLHQMGITVHNLSCRKWDAPKAVWRLYRLISKRKYDIVHVHLFPALYYVRLARYLSVKPAYIYTEHSTWNRRRRHPWLKLIDAFAYRGYDTIIANSEATKEALLSWLPSLAHKVKVIENGIPPVKTSKRCYILSKPPALLFVGRLVPAKGADIAIDALRLLEKQGVSVSLTIVGDGPDRTKLEKRAKGLNVHFIGYHANPTELMAKHDILIIPSRWEGFGLVAIEGMAVGIPVVASRVPGLSQVVRNGETGLLFASGDKEELATAIIRLLTDEELRARLGQHGREEALKRWPIDRFVDEMVKLYKELA